MKLNKKIIASLILGIIASAVISFFILDIGKNINENSQTFLSQKKELVLVENKIKDLEDFENDYKANQGDLEKINNLFINPQDPSNFIDFLNFIRKTATDSEVAIDISPPSQYSGEPWHYLIFQISGKGKFINFMKLLEKIENSPYLIEVPNLSVAGIKSEREKISSQNEINFNLSLKSFILSKKNE